MQKVIKAIKDCVAAKTCCEETGVDCNQGRNCPVREGTHKPAEAVHQIQEPTVNQQLTIEREAFEEWAIKEYPSIRLDRKGDGYRYALAKDWWKVWKARAALAATPAEKSNSVEFDGIKTARPVVLPEPFAYVEHHKAGDNLWFDCPGGKYSGLYTEQQVRALLATGGQAQAAMNQASEAMKLALSSHGLTLTSYPPQDAWATRGVSGKLSAAIAAIAAAKGD